MNCQAEHFETTDHVNIRRMSKSEEHRLEENRFLPILGLSRRLQALEHIERSLKHQRIQTLLGKALCCCEAVHSGSPLNTGKHSFLSPGIKFTFRSERSSTFQCDPLLRHFDWPATGSLVCTMWPFNLSDRRGSFISGGGDSGSQIRTIFGSLGWLTVGRAVLSLLEGLMGS